MWFEEYLVRHWLPEGRSGDWRIERVRFEGDFAEWFEQHDLASGLTPPGLYTVLFRGDECWMTDQPRELLDSRLFCEAAAGRVLITGLGIGAVPAWLAKQDRVDRIDIVERNIDVINLVWPHLEQRSSKLHLHHADAWQWLPDATWDMAWHDIWPKYPTEADCDAIVRRFESFVKSQWCWQPYEASAL